MPDEKSLFHTTGPSWSERASLPGLHAVLAPEELAERRNQFLHGIHRFGAACALRYLPAGGLIIDFGCGTGRFTRFFASRGRGVLGTEITPEMISRARTECLELGCEFVLTDGISIPLADESVDGIWCCAVLRYSLFVSNPAYVQIAQEMFRVLRPGACVVNCEMYVDVLPDVFLPDFERAGFKTHKISVLQRYGGKPERLLSNRFIPNRWLPFSASLCAFLRSRFDDPRRVAPGLRDYLFVWQKPAVRESA
jgi:SAM-dependent methyltransferase